MRSFSFVVQKALVLKFAHALTFVCGSCAHVDIYEEPCREHSNGGNCSLFCCNVLRRNPKNTQIALRFGVPAFGILAQQSMRMSPIAVVSIGLELLCSTSHRPMGLSRPASQGCSRSLGRVPVSGMWAALHCARVCNCSSI